MNWTLSALTFLSMLAQAHAPSDPSTCYSQLHLGKEFVEDHFYQPLKMQAGPYQGECLDNRQRRNIKLLDAQKDEKLLKSYGVTPKRNHTYFANFKHRNGYYIAEYPNQSIEHTFLVFEKFIELGEKAMEKTNPEIAMRNIVLTGHIQLRFRLKKNYWVSLYPQHKHYGKMKKVNDFAYAMFAVRPKSISGQVFDPLGDGVFQGYVMSQNFMSTYDVALAYKNYVTKSTEVSQFIINKEHFDSEKAIMALLRHADKEYRLKKPRFYHTWRRNCVTETFVGIDAGAIQSLESRLIGIGIGALRPSKSIGTLGREWNPLFVLSNLERREIIQPRAESEGITLNEEVCFILKGKDLEDIKEHCR